MLIPEPVKKWGRWGWALLVALSVVVALYQYYFAKPSIFFRVVSEVNVLDIHQPLRDLQIIFRGDNIQEKNLNLRIYTVKIENSGDTDILQNHFDQNDDWGIRVENARIIETRLVNSNSEYIIEHLSPQIKEDRVVKFDKIIFDQGDFFTVELLVLHDKNKPPHLYQIGKIAGIQDSDSEISILENGESFLAILFYGNWLVQTVRVVLYFLVSVAAFLAFIYAMAKAQERKTKSAQNPQSKSDVYDPTPTDNPTTK